LASADIIPSGATSTPAPRGRGQPTKFTPETQRILLAAFAGNAAICDACEMAGIDDSTYRRWHEDALARGEDSQYFTFFTQVQSALGAGKVNLWARWTRIAEKDWRACERLLERRYPESLPPRVTRSEMALDQRVTGSITTTHIIDASVDPLTYLRALNTFIRERDLGRE
jgi:hypothetical protein